MPIDFNGLISLEEFCRSHVFHLKTNQMQYRCRDGSLHLDDRGMQQIETVGDSQVEC